MSEYGQNSYVLRISVIYAALFPGTIGIYRQHAKPWRNDNDDHI